MNPKRGSCKLCQRPYVVYTSINIGKIKFIAHIYIHFDQNLDEKFYIRAKIEVVKHLQCSLSGFRGQCRRPIRLEKAMFYFDVNDVV